MNGTSNVTSRSNLIQPFYPALDGFRAVAFLLVFAVHFGPLVSDAPILRWGWIGVDVFFVLSGFLITGILYDSLEKPNFFKTFYTRRALRIFPLFYSFWILMLLVTPLLHIEWNRYLLAMVLYMGNWFSPAANAGLHAHPDSIPFSSLVHPGVHRVLGVGHFWSLCVEEQFYLVWPAVVWFVRTRKALLRICVTSMFVVPAYRIFAFHLDPQGFVNGNVYGSTIARLDTLLIGAALALWLRGPVPHADVLRRLGKVTAGIAGTTLLLICWARPAQPHTFGDAVVGTVGFSLIAISAAALLLVTLHPETLAAKVLCWRPFVAVGRLSYGLYFFHCFLVDYAVGKVFWFRSHHVLFLLPVVAFAISFAAAKFSFRWLESPFLRLKERLAVRPGAFADPPAADASLHSEPGLPAALQDGSREIPHAV